MQSGQNLHWVPLDTKGAIGTKDARFLHAVNGCRFCLCSTHVPANNNNNNNQNNDKIIIIPMSILHKSIAGRYRPVRVADGPIMTRYRFL